MTRDGQEEDTWKIFYEFFVDQLDEGIHVVDRHGRTLIYNQKMAIIEAMSKEDVLNKDVLDVFTFPKEGYSTLLHALYTGQATQNSKQVYYNVKGHEITTINNTVPFVIAGEIVGAVEIARDITKIERIQENIWRRNELRYTFESVIGSSKSLIDVIDQAKRAARTNSSILIVGETGTGKEMIAQSIHHASPRSAGPFISQNCAALPESLIEGILFGTCEGVFPGAMDRPGLLEQGDHGTLLLDELHSLSLPLQAKLLRVIQERTVRRLGDTKNRIIDVRILATISEDPFDAVTAGRLRKDLYYRLSVVTLFLPPLREREGDISLLTAYFLDKYNDLFHLHVQSLSDDVTRYFETHLWPGNIRELQHTIEGAMNLVSDHSQLDIVHLPFHMRRKVNMLDETSAALPFQSARYPTSIVNVGNLHTHLVHFERTYVLKTLEKNNGNISLTARELGISRQSLQYRLRKWTL